MIVFSASVRSARASSDDAITTSSVGIPVKLALDREFNGLAKTVVFKAGRVSVDIALVGDSTTCQLPPDVLRQAGKSLYIGIYAADQNGTIVIPTVWASVGMIQQGVIPSGVNPSARTPSWVAQVQQTAEHAEEVAQSVRSDADAGAFNGRDGIDGIDGIDGVSPTITVTDISGGHHVQITDANGEQNFDIPNGINGTNGTNGLNGTTVWKATSAPSAVRVGSQTYMGWQSYKLSGRTGLIPAVNDLIFYGSNYYSIYMSYSGYYCAESSSGTSIKGSDGSRGANGVSPTVEVTEITGGHTVTITDVNGEHPFDVMDGTSGDPAAWFEYGTSSSSEIEDAYQAGQVCIATRANDTRVYILSDRLSSTDHVFTAGTSTRVYYLECVNGAWSSGSSLIPAASSAIPEPLGTADAGIGTTYARADHVHEMPTAVDVGAYELPYGGIPKTDLERSVQLSLDKADTALQDSEVAWFTYGVSTSAEIEAAYQAGKVCLVDYNTRIYVLTVRNSATSHRFSSAIHSNVYTVLCSSDSWSVNNRDIPAAATATPSNLGTAAVGTSTKYAKEDHVHAMPSASEVGAVGSDQGVANAGKIMVVGSDGIVRPITMSDWQGGNY